MTTGLHAHVSLATALSAIEQDLIAALDLKPIDLHADARTRQGRWRNEPLTLTARAYRGPLIRYARFVVVAGGEIEIANALCLPDPRVAAPMLGIDLVRVRADHVVVAADLVPDRPQRPVERATALPRWAEQFFSSDALLFKGAIADAASPLAAAARKADAFTDRLWTVRPDPWPDRLRAEWQDAYCHAHRRDDRGLALLGRMFGDEWAERFIADVMFPAAAIDDADQALARLRAATRAAHDALDAHLHLMDPGTTVDDYRRFLRAMAACAIPIEAAIAARAPAELAIPLHDTPRARWLRQDLIALGDDGNVRALTPPSFADWTHALGAAYVLEGATLGGQVLSRHLATIAGIPDSALTYLRSYGNDVGPRWRAFRGYLGATMAASPDAEARVTLGAQSAFAAFTRALGA